MKQHLKNLDILTEKGQKTLLEENLVIQKLRDKWKVQVINTNKDDCAAIDNILVRDNTIVAICEIKCRHMTHKQLTSFGNTWLITNQKIKEGAQVSRLL